jgi:hypothetical protein
MKRFACILVQMNALFDQTGVHASISLARQSHKTLLLAFSSTCYTLA